jgi:hypothetical protein
MNLSEILINVLKYFRFYFHICWGLQFFMHSAYSQYKCWFAPHICTGNSVRRSTLYTEKFRLRSTLFRVISKYLQIHSVYILLYKQIHSAYSQYTYTDSFRSLFQCTQIFFDIRNEIIFFTTFIGTLLQKTVCEQLDIRPRNNWLFSSDFRRQKFLIILIIRGTTFDFKYLGEFKFILKNNLG